MRKIALFIAAATVAAIAPFGAHADHCNDIFLFSGIDTGVEGARAGLNLGAEGCTGPLASNEDADTRFLTPGAQHAWVGAFEDFAPTEGEVSIDGGAPIALTFSFNDVRGRYESQTFDVAGAQEVVVEAIGSSGKATTTYTALV